MNTRIGVVAILSMALLVFPSARAVQARQFLPVKGIVNARDLGGWVLPDGTRVREGLFVRCAHLADATPEDIAYLQGLHISEVVDFRKESEKNGRVDKEIPGARYVALPIDASGNVVATATDKEKKRYMGRRKFDVRKVIVLLAFNDKAKAVARDLYPNILFNPASQRQMAAFLRLAVDSGGKPVLFHCSQGKDRTGVASALILAALGADRKTLMADFDATNQVYAKDVEKYTRRVKFWGGKDEETAVVRTFLGANTESVAKALDMVEQRYGSLEAYLTGPMGLDPDDLKTLRERCLVNNKQQ